MKHIKLLVCPIIFVFATCKNNQTIKRTSELQPDPTATLVPDSLKYLLPILDSVWYRDQFYRFDASVASPKEEREKNKELKRNLSTMKEWDKKNLAIVEEIISKHGWLGPKEVGIRGMMALFLSIQHADLKTQEKYLPLIRQAAIDKKIISSGYAMLADRVETKNKRPQIYGTQINIAGGKAEIMPLLNPDSVDIWRNEIRMGETISEYVNRWHIKWDKEQYKKELPALMKKYGFQL